VGRLIAIILALSTAAEAAQPPRAALQYKRPLMAESARVFGLGSPVPMFAAQIHQESAWRADARSPVGALGLTQFMPATADWIGQLYPTELANPAPFNPTWAIRAMLRYNHWLFARVPRSPDVCDLWWFTLRAYNGGLGHVQAEARLASAVTRSSVDSQCGNARRSVRHCAENLSYPRLIIERHQPRYRSWGVMLECGAHGNI